MKKQSYTNIILFTFCIFCSNSFAQINRPAVDLKSEWNDKSELVYSAINSDYCDYYVTLDFNEMTGYASNQGVNCKALVRPGQTTITKLTRLGGSSGSVGRIWYRHYRGNPKAKPNPDFVYALPIKVGDSVQVQPAQSRIYKLMFNATKTNDTIYAARAGKVCNNDLYDSTTKFRDKNTTITICHKDGSFADYNTKSNFEKILAYAGDNIEIGQPIAIVKEDEKGFKTFAFSVYYLDENKLKDESGAYSGLVPIFHTADKGDIKLDPKTTYISELTKELILQDMSKKEREKYEKNLLKKKK